MKKTNLSDKNVHSWQRKLIFGIAIIMSFVIITVQSCTKDSTELTENTESAISAKDMTAMERVNHFNSVVNKTELGNRDSQYYTGEEAVLGVETLLNYEYDDLAVKCFDRYIERDTLLFNKPTGVINDAVIGKIYDDVLSLMECHFGRVSGTNKKELFVDMQLVSDNSQEIQIGVTNVLGTPPPSPLPFQFVFASGDDWDAMAGKCYNVYHPSNGGEQVQKYTNWNLTGMNQLAGTWFSDLDEVFYPDESDGYWHGLNENDNIQNDNIMDYHLWKSYSSALNVLCLEHNELNYYLGNSQYEASRYEPILNKTFMNIDIWSDFSPGDGAPGSPSSVLVWWGLGEYGVKHYDPSRISKVIGPCVQQ